MKRLLSFVLLLSMLLGMLILPAAAAEDTEETETTEATEETEAPEETSAPEKKDNRCGDGLTWELEGSTLTISGDGAMDDYLLVSPPWYNRRFLIKTIILDGSVTRIGAEAFADCDAVTKVDFGDALEELGCRSFAGSDGLTSITLPKTFKNLDEECLKGCRKLTEIHFEGSMPHFRLNCLWDTTAKLYFPVKNPWPVRSIQELEEAFHGRIEFLASDGSDPFVPVKAEDPTEQPTEETIEETVEETTEATVPETTEEPTVPETTQETTAATEQILPVIEETEPEKTMARSGTTFGLAMVVFVLVAVAIGAIIFRLTNHHSRKYGRRR